MIRKIGGIYWLRLGRIRIAFCITKPKPTMRHGYPLKTWTRHESNAYFF